VPLTNPSDCVYIWCHVISRSQSTVATETMASTQNTSYLGSDLSYLSSDLSYLGSDLSYLGSDLSYLGSDLL